MDKDERHMEIDKGTLKELDGRLYVPKHQMNNITTGNEVIPLYFAKTCRTEILHDSPVIGAYEYGERHPKIDGPFSSEQEANAAINRRNEETEHLSYEFSSKVIAKCFAPNELPTHFETYTSQRHRVCAGYDGVMEVGTRWIYDVGLFRDIFESIPAYVKRVTQMLIDASSDHHQDEGRLAAMIGETMLESWFSKCDGGRSFDLRTISRTDNDIERILYSALQEEGIPAYAFVASPPIKHLIVSPGPAPSLRYRSISDFIEAHDFID